MLTLAEIRHGLAGHLLKEPTIENEYYPVGQVVVDSRQVTPGALFVALRGDKDDGHRFVAEALSRGAAAILAERLPDGLPSPPMALFLVDDSLRALQSLAGYWRGQRQAKVIGVTGSVGKTTTKEAIAALLAPRYRVLKNEGNLNNEIGLPLTLLGLDDSHQVAVLEMGMYDRGEIAALCKIAHPSLGVVTNVGPTHLERLGSLDNIALAKQELVESLPAQGVAILNGDDPLVRGMAAACSGRVIFYGQGAACSVGAEGVESHGLDGIGFRLHTPQGDKMVTTPLPGRHSVYPVLAAAAVALEMGLNLDEVAAGLGQLTPSLRLLIRPGPRGSIVIDDTYNSSPASTLAALDLLAELPERKIAVLGDMLELGAFEEEGHRQVGRRAAETVDQLIVLGERARLIGQEAQAQGLKQVFFASSIQEVISRLKPALTSGQAVLVKGSRGMAMEKIVVELAP